MLGHDHPQPPRPAHTPGPVRPPEGVLDAHDRIFGLVLDQIVISRVRWSDHFFGQVLDLVRAEFLTW